MRLLAKMFQIFIVLVLVQSCSSKKVSVADEVARFSASNGFQSINIIYSKGREKETVDVLKSLSSTNILGKAVKFEDVLDQGLNKASYQQRNIKVEEKFIWLLQRKDIEEKATLNVLLGMLDQMHIKNSLLILDSFVDWKELYGEADLNAYFFTFTSNSEEKWLQILALNKVPKAIVRELDLKVVNGQIMAYEQHDLQNMTITCSTLGYNLDSILGECDALTLECRNNSGYFWVLMDALEKLINVTVVAYKEPSNLWGSSPELSNDTQNKLQWTGVLGSLEKRDHHIGSALWLLRNADERFEAFDFSMAWFRTYAMFFTQKRTFKDTLFLLRPFTPLAWKAIALVTFAILLLKHFITGFPLRDLQNAYSTKSMIISANIFLVLLHAYYSGALTMFTVTQESVPFSNLEEAIDAYPIWKIIIPKETVIRLEYLMPNKTKAYEELLNRIQMNDTETVVDNLEQGLETVKQTRSVLVSSLNDVSQHKNMSLKRILLRQSPLFVVLGQNSPLTPSFQWGLLRLWECGQTRHIFQNALVQSSHNDEDPAPITLEETKLAFFLMGMAVLCSLTLLVMEKLHPNSAALFGQFN